MYSFDSGKSAMAATVGIDSDFPYVKVVSFSPLGLCVHPTPALYRARHLSIYILSFLCLQISAETMIGLSESSKCAQIVKVCSSCSKNLIFFPIALWSPFTCLS